MIAAAWLLATLAGGWAAATLGPHLSQRFDAPNRPAFYANREISEITHAGGQIAPFVLAGDAAQAHSFARIAQAVPGARSVIAGPGLTSASGLRVGLVFPPPGKTMPNDNPAALAALEHAARGSGVLITGQVALTDGPSSGGASLLVETLLGGLGALVVLVLVFGSALAAVPIILAVVSILTTFLVLRGLAAGFSISFVVQFLVGLIGLGVSIDYSLLLVVRWREERDQGAAPDQAVTRAMATAGRSILISGTTVGIGLIALIAVPVPFIRSIGVGGLLIPVTTVLATLTLLPGLLVSLGPRLDRRRDTRRQLRASVNGGEPAGSRDGEIWRTWAGWVVRNRWAAALGGLAVMVVLAAFATGLNPGEPAVRSLTSSGPAHQGLIKIEQAKLGAGTLSPIEVLVGAKRAAAEQHALGGVPGVRTVLAPTGPDWAGQGRRLLEVLPLRDPATSAGRSTLNLIRARHSASVLVGGVNAQDSDLTNAIYSSFPIMAALIAVLTFILLALALRSIVLPLKAIALNILSVAAAFGVIVIVWQNGHGSEAIGSLPGTGAVTNWVPLSVFAFLYGLSMDYEVFILSRIREEHDSGRETSEAVIAGLSRTGRLVTSAALILFLAFIALAATPETSIKTMATGLAAGIALDATVIRACVVPALITLFGRANWWWPLRRPGSRSVV